MGVQSEIIKIDSHFGVKTHNKWLTQEASSDKLLIMLPGRAYTCDFPALYYLRNAAVELGYDVLSIEYSFQAAQSDFEPQQLPDLADDIQRTVQPVLKHPYKQICVAGKSLGTPLAANLAQSITHVAVSLLFLTPVGDSTQNLGGLRTLAIIGTSDPLYSAEVVAASEGHPNLKWHGFDDLDHGLEITGHWRESLHVLPKVIGACAGFLGEYT